MFTPPLIPVRRVVYLHGFSSSPASSKAQRFGRELAARGVGFACPDLNEPAFETLTVTRMLDQVDRVLDADAAAPVALVGSSLGAFVAVHAAAREAARSRRIDRLILMAPARDFGGNRLRQLGDHGIDEWRRSGRLRIFHYAANEERDVHFDLYTDAARYDAFALPSPVPTLIFQGRHDQSVDPATVERWASARPSVDLRMLDDDHQLTRSIDLIWKESETFLGLTTF
jgi:pimeloyl-ACP methyl ester carboxylesterase